jgi:hypothetical protein
MLLLLLNAVAASAGLTLAQPIHPEQWIEFMPSELVGERGANRFRAIVSDRGKVERCDIVDSPPQPDLDKATCAFIMARSVFAPAHDQNGSPIASIYENAVFWDTRPRSIKKPDITIDVNKLPYDLKGTVYIRADVVIGIDGQLETCVPTGNTKTHVFEPIACDEVKRAWKTSIIYGMNGQPMRYIKSVFVAFEIASPAIIGR